MRDFKAGHDIHIEGNVLITDQSNQPQSLVQYTNERLYEEREQRMQGRSRERKRKIKICSVLGGCGEAILGGVALWFYLQGNVNLSSLILGFGSLAAVVFSLQYVYGRNEVEQRHVDAIRDIDVILRERGAK
jgi:hypothetical protein